MNKTKPECRDRLIRPCVLVYHVVLVVLITKTSKQIQMKEKLNFDLQIQTEAFTA